jgi:hypothetical protein
MKHLKKRYIQFSTLLRTGHSDRCLFLAYALSSFHVPNIHSAIPFLPLLLEHQVCLPFIRVSVCNIRTTGVRMSATLLTLSMTYSDKELVSEYHYLLPNVIKFVLQSSNIIPLKVKSP